MPWLGLLNSFLAARQLVPVAWRRALLRAALGLGLAGLLALNLYQCQQADVAAQLAVARQRQRRVELVDSVLDAVDRRRLVELEAAQHQAATRARNQQRTYPSQQQRDDELEKRYQQHRLLLPDVDAAAEQPARGRANGH